MTEIVIPVVPQGHFVWDDHNTCLEFVSDATVDFRDRRRRNKNAVIHGGPGPRQMKAAPDMRYSTTASILGGKSIKGGAMTIAPTRGSAKSVVPHVPHSTITLKDVKRVAMDLLEMESKDTKSNILQASREFVDTPEFDSFLIALLHYFTCFFDQLQQQLKPLKTSFLEPSKAELQAQADTKKKMEITRRKLGQSYCVLILGLGIEKYHHMGCGKKRVSNTHRDKRMFEDLYLFCTFVVWITFRRKEYERVQIEVGNILRSEVFNPALQQKHKASVTAESKQQNKEKSRKEPEKIEIETPEIRRPGPKPIAERIQDLLNAKLPTMERLTPAQHRRKTGKRPAIRSAVNQRSTALVALLPLPKEESNYLFRARKGKFPQKLSEDDQSEAQISDFVIQKIGIIGEKTDLFDMDDLLPKNTESGEDTDSNVEGNGNEENSPASSERRISHQGDVLSRVTTAE